MDPISLVVGALAAGAATGLTETATGAVKDAYAGLRGLVSRLFMDRPTGKAALEEHEQNPQLRAALAAELEKAGAASDQEIIAAAQRVLAAVGPQSSKYLIDLRNAQVGLVGDHNTQTVTFGDPPRRL